MNDDRLPGLRHDDAATFQGVSRALTALQAEWLGLCAKLATPAPGGVPGAGAPSDPAGARAARARLLARQRRHGARVFGHLSPATGDRAWDLLIELYVAACERRDLTAAGLFDPLDLPPSVGARWLRHLAAEGLVAVGGTGDDDGPVSLTGRGAGLMERYLDGLPQGEG